MKRFLILLAVLLLPFAAGAQEFAGRASVGVDYKVFKGFHLGAEQEFRTNDSFSGVGSLRTSVSVSYKPVKYVKFGLGYTFIEPWKVDKELSDGTLYTGFWAPKHRLSADVAGNIRLGYVQLSLKEKVQMTHNGDSNMNTYQAPRNLVQLKSRFTVKYKGWRAVEPLAAFELRTCLNGAWGSVSDNKFVLEGYNHIYNDRYRVNLEADIKLGKHHTLTPYVLLDYITEYEIDTTKKGKFKSAAYTDVFRTSLGIAYVFDF